jgi:hypothetical protein
VLAKEITFLRIFTYYLNKIVGKGLFSGNGIVLLVNLLLIPLGIPAGEEKRYNEQT